MKLLNTILKFVLFVAGMTLVILGQKSIGYSQTLMMLAGLGMLLYLIYAYNKKFNH